MSGGCDTCKHYPSDEHCKGCILNLMNSSGNTNWSLKVLEPEEPFINKPCVSEGVCHEDKMKVLEKIKAEIEYIKKVKKDLLVTCGDEYTKTMMKSEILGIETVLLVVDKYIAESEDEE